jgi:hypothetical protein
MNKQTINYKNNENVKRAFLFNCLRSDLVLGAGIGLGSIVKGAHGYVIAERDVPDVSGAIVEFEANGECSLKGKTLACMCLPGTPKNKDLKCMNYVVAEVGDQETFELLKRRGVPVIKTEDGRRFANLEIDRFDGQAFERRATIASLKDRDQE